MLQVVNITKAYGDDVILDNVSFVINPHDRVGLIGANGCGKTTLLRIIIGDERPDNGAVQFNPPDLQAGYLAQGLNYAEGDTLADLLYVKQADIARAAERVTRLAAQLALPDAAQQARVMDEYSQALDELERLTAAQTTAHDAAAILAGLGLGDLPLDTPVDILSGGQKTRLGLARLLLTNPQLLLLDEPTNHLDIEALAWLEGWLQDYRGALLIVSHDRAFLDRTINTILELAPDTHTVTSYPGNYSAYLEAKMRERDKQWTAYKDQQEHMARMHAGIQRLANYADSIERGSIHFHIRKIAKGIARRAVVQKRRLERELTEERLEKPARSWQMKLEFADTPPSGQDVIILENLAVGYNDAPLFREVNQILRAGERVALVGPNGAGKTTLLRVIAEQLQPLEGNVRLGANVQLGYYAQEQEDLAPEDTPFTTIRGVAALSETEVRAFLHYFLFAGDEVFVPNGKLSYGERARLVLARLVAAGCNCLLLDEPINHLDIPSRARFEQAIANFAGTILAVVHDRYFIRQFASQIWALADGELRRYVDLDDLLKARN